MVRTLRLRMVVLALALGACVQGGLPLPPGGPEVVPPPSAQINFVDLQWWAKRASAAYDPPATIRAALPDVVHVQMLDRLDVQYFIERNDRERLQTIAVRGTSNLENAWLDLEYTEALDSKLRIWVHRGFDASARAVLADALPHLDATYRTRVTGHSLGAAIGAILMMYLHNAGYALERSINFGQPKVTNRLGVTAFGFLPLVRVVHDEDPVPLVPPVTLLDSIHGIYQHVGAEVILLRGPYYTTLIEHDAARRSVGSFFIRERTRAKPRDGRQRRRSVIPTPEAGGDKGCLEFRGPIGCCQSGSRAMFVRAFVMSFGDVTRARGQERGNPTSVDGVSGARLIKSRIGR